MTQLLLANPLLHFLFTNTSSKSCLYLLFLLIYLLISPQPTLIRFFSTPLHWGWLMKAVNVCVNKDHWYYRRYQIQWFLFCPPLFELKLSFNTADYFFLLSALVIHTLLTSPTSLPALSLYGTSFFFLKYECRNVPRIWSCLVFHLYLLFILRSCCLVPWV